MILQANYPTVRVEYDAGMMATVDITADIVSPISVSYGFSNNTVIDRVASTGQMTFTLRNDAGCYGGIAGYYSPNLPIAHGGWNIGREIILTILDGVTEYVKFRGRIVKIEPTSGSYGVKQVRVVAYDWIDRAANSIIENPEIVYDKRIDEVVPLVIADMAAQPKVKVYNRGTDVFPTVFDTVKTTTKVLSEFNKLALSELGYIYIKRDKTYGDTLVVEGRHTRNSTNTVIKIPLPLLYSSKLTTETLTDHLLLETGDHLYYDECLDASFDNDMVNLNVSYGTNIANQVITRAYPRRVDTAPHVLFSLQNPLSFTAGETKTGIRGTFTDPDGKATKVTGITMLDPVGGVDWLAYEGADGTGIDLTSDFYATADYDANSVTYDVTCSGLRSGYLTRLQARGYGIYLYDYVENIASDTDSIDDYGYIPLTIDMKYQDDATATDVLGDILLARDKDPKQVVKSVDFIANSDYKYLGAFLNVDMGDLVYIQEDQTGTDDYYYIDGVSYEITQGGIINFSWKLREAVERKTVYWILNNATNSVLGSTTRLAY